VAKKKKPRSKVSLSKPTLAASTSRSAQAKQFAAGSKSGLVPKDDRRLTANIHKDLHKKLKYAAVDRETTVGELLEELIRKHL